MKKIFSIIAIILSFLTGSVQAATNRIEVPEGNLVFSLSDKWKKQDSVSQKAPKMDASDPLMLRWKREGITDQKGTLVTSGLNVVTFHVQQDTDVVFMSHSLMTRRKWPFKKFLTAKEDGLVIPNSMGYLTEFKPNDDILIKAFVIHAINNGKFVEIVLSTTDEIFAQIEPEFRAIIQSINLMQK